jgi:hypothetical protein
MCENQRKVHEQWIHETARGDGIDGKGIGEKFDEMMNHRPCDVLKDRPTQMSVHNPDRPCHLETTVM